MRTILAIPAYGRDYIDESNVISDWNANKDFQDTLSGSYLNKQDCERLGVKVIVQYSQRMKELSVN